VKKIGVINGLRGLAILGVIYQHLFWETTRPGWRSVDVAGIKFFPFTLVSNGWIGVNLFFILSGFVLFLPYAEGARKIDSAKDAARFYLHRARRLMPLYYLSIFLSMFFFYDIIHQDGDGLRNFLLMITATFNFTVDMWLPKYNPLLWSIGIEIWFCVLFPVFVVITGRTGIFKLFVALSAMALAVRYAGVHYESFFLIDSPYQNALKDSLAGRIDDFALGMLIAVIYVRRLGSEPLKRPLIYLALGLLAIAFGCSLWDMRVTGTLPAFIVPLINNVFHAGFFLVIVSLLSMEGGPVRYLFANRPLQVLGMMCYSVYIWHQLVLFAVIRENDYTVFYLSAYFVVLFAIAVLTYRYLEFGRKSSRELFLLERTTPESPTVQHHAPPA
jgi:peptidoglycan/LPS O-acetylase OafA/YrhL